MQYTTNINKERQERNERIYEKINEYKDVIDGQEITVNVFAKQPRADDHCPIPTNMTTIIKRLARIINTNCWI